LPAEAASPTEGGHALSGGILQRDQSQGPGSSHDSLLTVTPSTPRRAERLGREEIPRCLARRPSLQAALPSELPLGSLEAQLEVLRGPAVTLAKTAVKDALQEMQCLQVLGRRREQIARKVNRLSLVRAAEISATVNPKWLSEVAENPLAWMQAFAHLAQELQK
jgi:hypothetical protein